MMSLSDLTDNDFTDSGSEILESETEESVYLDEEDDEELIPPSPPQIKCSWTNKRERILH